MIAISANLAAQSSQLHRGKTQATLSIAMQRLSSGLRINSAKNDAAGQAIANRTEANQRANRQIARHQ